MQVNIQRLIDDVQCYQTVRELRWPDGVACPSCESKDVIKRGFDDTEPARQRYECHNCNTRSLLLDSRVLRDQQLNERRKQRFASLADVMHEREEPQVDREFLLGNAPMRTQPTA